MSILLLHKKNHSRRKLLERARAYAVDHGERLILVMADPTWEADFADRVEVADTANIDDTLSAVRRLVADEAEPIRGVITLSEFCVPVCAAVSTELGLPGNSPETAYRARDKVAMRTAIDGAAKVRQPRFAVARTVQEAQVAAQDIGYPVILKPVIGCHSMYVLKVDDPEAVATHFPVIQKGGWEGFAFDPLHERSRRAHDGGILIEEFIAGTEISVESIIVDGVTHSITVHDKPLVQHDTFEEVYASTPTRLDDGAVTALYDAVRNVHDALGITSGASHVEFRLSSDGVPYLLEAGARLGGGPIYRCVLHATGIDLVQALLDVATGREPDLTPKWWRPTGFRNMFPAVGGQVVDIVGVKDAESDADVFEVEVFRVLGDFADVPPNTYEGHGHVIFRADDFDQLDDRFRDLLQRLRIETDGELTPLDDAEGDLTHA